MQLEQAFRISNTACIALTGSGGKTTALFHLARSLTRPAPADMPGRPAAKENPRVPAVLAQASERPVIVTATAHLHVDQIRLADSHWIGETPEDFSGLEGNLHGLMLVTGPITGSRSMGLNNNTVAWLHALCLRHDMPLLIEADGSRQRPLKAPAEHEPPIPDFVRTVAVVAGLSGLGKPLNEEFVHRPEIFARLSGLSMGETITSDALLRVLIHPAGGLKNIPAQANRLVLLNQADTAELQAQARTLAGNLLSAYHSVIIASLGQSRIHAVYEPVAGIILAAGEAKRFGLPKQLLDYHGQPFVRAVAKTALASGLTPVVVVTGANAETVEAALHDLPVTIARNSDWQIGQSSSIKTGLQALCHPPLRDSSPKFLEFGGGRVGVGAAVFLLADQPQVSSTIIHALAEEHSRTLAPILAPMVADQRANPVLFDRVAFPDLMSLTGDVGGRAIFGKHPVTYLPWQDESLLLDVDTPEDFERLRNQEL